MKWTWKEILEHFLSAGFVTAAIAFIGQSMGWLRFKKKDTADVRKVNAETASSMADVANKKIDDEVKISKAALEWTVQLAGQLEKANAINDKRQLEIDSLRQVIQKMREDFDKTIDSMEKLLAESRNECDEEREKNRVLLEKLNVYINAGK